MCIYKYIHPNKTFLAEASHSVSFQRKMLKHFLQKKKKKFFKQSIITTVFFI